MPNIIAAAGAFTGLAFVAAFLGSVLFTYPHIGWRRLSIVTGVALSLAAGALANGSVREASTTGLLALLPSCVAVIAARELYRSIRRGFSTS